MICGTIRTLFFSEAQYFILIWGKWRELTTLLIINQTLRTVKGQLNVIKIAFMWITRSLCIFLLMFILVKISKMYLVVYKSESLTDRRQMLPLWFRSEPGIMEPKMRKTSVSRSNKLYAEQPITYILMVSYSAKFIWVQVAYSHKGKVTWV